MKNSNISIFSIQYFGGIEFYTSIMHNKPCIIEQHEHYQKRTNRNRLSLLGPNGVETLSVPLAKGKNARMPITEVKIAYDENWPKQHIQSIQSYYGSSPFLSYYIDEISNTLFKEYQYLWKLDLAMMQLVCKFLSIEEKFVFTQEYLEDSTHDYRNSNSSLYTDMQSKLWEKLRYNQVFEEKHGFIKHLSILDMLFCCGPETILRLNRLVLP